MLTSEDGLVLGHRFFLTLSIVVLDPPPDPILIPSGRKLVHYNKSFQ
jgi:hypothetical protein